MNRTIKDYKELIDSCLFQTKRKRFSMDGAKSFLSKFY